MKPKQANKTVKSTGKQEQSHLFSNEDADNHHILPIFDNFQKLDSTLGKRNSKESENMNGMGQSKGDQKYSQQVGTALNKKQIFPPQDIPMNLTKVNKKYPKHFNQIKEVSDSLNITEAPLQTSRRNNQESTQAQMQVVNEIMGNPNAKQPKQTQQGPNKSKYPAHHQLLNFLSTTNNPQSNNLVQKHTLKHHPSKSAAMKLKESNSNENQMNSGRNPTHNYEQHSLVQGAFTRSNSTDREDSEEKDNPLEESIPLKHFSGAGGKNNLSLVMNYHQPNLGGRSMALHQTQMNRETHRSKPSNTTSSKIEQYLSQSHLHQMNTLNQGIEAKYYNSGIDIVGDSGKNIGTVEQVSALKQALRFIRPDDERLSHQVASGNGIRLIEGILPTKLDAGIHRHQYYKTIDDEEGCDYQPVSDEWIY